MLKTFMSYLKKKKMRYLSVDVCWFSSRYNLYIKTMYFCIYVLDFRCSMDQLTLLCITKDYLKNNSSLENKLTQ